jgi:hypothetical protein
MTFAHVRSMTKCRTRPISARPDSALRTMLAERCLGLEDVVHASELQAAPGGKKQRRIECADQKSDPTEANTRASPSLYPGLSAFSPTRRSLLGHAPAEKSTCLHKIHGCGAFQSPLPPRVGRGPVTCSCRSLIPVYITTPPRQQCLYSTPSRHTLPGPWRASWF